ncbi:DUF2937 family protein [Albidovulum sp.]|uniref:DUF2937 family protein n=1 Tax=Albidovulum sp. TaxID=1872424 RepID=UPI001DB9093D|nr:DUF2937 family protein [Paracoccaceae bacterium]MCC0047447.1 DUF2937 family protein [Defluviimonas sp.]HPE25351.1 DUF2937 family protein [Albidovulum sp.]MCB2119109.1 DUF2937 family protein [Paracoccaceae bacterium]MCB2122359.1 DUF2937 family protein [Paracoccaceae bacterium]
MLRLMSLAGGMAGALALSQFPEFSQQYLQRLAGKVDALEKMAGEFDASAEAAGLSREAALASLSGNAFAGLHQADLRTTFGELDRLRSDLALLREAGPVERTLLPHRFLDTETFAATWADFQPAVPATTAGMATGALGYLGGWAAVSILVSILVSPFRRREGGRARV